MNNEVASLYGGESYPMAKSENKVSTSINYSSKEVQEEVPMDAIIKSKDISISIREIENGFLKTISTSIRYSVREKEEGGEMEEPEYGEDKYMYQTKTYYSKEKPIDISLKYDI
jgi:hypothetical protein